MVLKELIGMAPSRATGYHAGRVELWLFGKARAGTSKRIGKAWFHHDSSTRWVYAQSQISDVWLREGYPASKQLHTGA